MLSGLIAVALIATACLSSSSVTDDQAAAPTAAATPDSAVVPTATELLPVATEVPPTAPVPTVTEAPASATATAATTTPEPPPALRPTPAPIAEPSPTAGSVATAVPPTATAVPPTATVTVADDATPTAVPPTRFPLQTAPPLVPTVVAAVTVTPTPVTPLPLIVQPDGPCGVGPLSRPNPDRPVYTGALTIDPPSGTVEGQLNIEFTPDLDVDNVYLRLWPNGPRGTSGGVDMQLLTVELAATGEAMPFDIVNRTTVQIPLDETLVAGDRIEFDVTFDLVVPSELRSRVSGRDDFMRLGTILPLMPWEPGRGWALDPATSLFAEAVSSPVSDYNITIELPDDYDVLASGVVDADGTWRVDSARDFAISVGRFRTVTGVAMAPEPVQVTVGIHETIDDDANEYLVKVIDSLEQFSSRWGQYPWPSLTFAVTPNLSGGIEFPTHIMQGQNTTGRVTSHEVGHMFFYSLVGSNQGTAPWLDEGITSYAEFTYEGREPRGFLQGNKGFGLATAPMTYWETEPQFYYTAVYSQTGVALQELGEQEDVDCALARYVADNAHQIATADDFLAAFTPIFPDVIAQLAELGVVIDR